MAVVNRFPVNKTSGEIVKYGDVEKEKEIEKRLKQLGLWENKVFQEKEVERRLEDKIDNSDRLSQVIRKARRRRERNEESEEIKEEKSGGSGGRDRGSEGSGGMNKKGEGLKTMGEIRNIVKPTIIRDKFGTPLAYHIDVTMGCFTCDVTHHVTNDGHVVVLFGATSPSNPLVSMSFLSSKSLPSLFSPSTSPRSASPSYTEVNTKLNTIANSGNSLGSTLRYGKESKGNFSQGKDDSNGDDYDNTVITDIKRLTKEISIELPKTVDVSQLIVDYRKGIFKLRVPFFLEIPNEYQSTSNEEELKRDNHHHSPIPPPNKPPSQLDSLKCQVSKTVSTSSPTSPSLVSKSTFKPSRLPISPASLSPSPLSPPTSHSTGKAFHCSLLPQSRATTSKNEYNNDGQPKPPTTSTGSTDAYAASSGQRETRPIPPSSPLPQPQSLLHSNFQPQDKLSSNSNSKLQLVKLQNLSSSYQPLRSTASETTLLPSSFSPYLSPSTLPVDSSHIHHLSLTTDDGSLTLLTTNPTPSTTIPTSRSLLTTVPPAGENYKLTNSHTNAFLPRDKERNDEINDHSYDSDLHGRSNNAGNKEDFSKLRNYFENQSEKRKYDYDKSRPHGDLSYNQKVTNKTLTVETGIDDGRYFIKTGGCLSNMENSPVVTTKLDTHHRFQEREPAKEKKTRKSTSILRTTTA